MAASELSALVGRMKSLVMGEVVYVESIKYTTDVVSKSNLELLENMTIGASLWNFIKSIFSHEKLVPASLAASLVREEVESKLKFISKRMAFNEDLKNMVDKLAIEYITVTPPCEIANDVKSDSIASKPVNIEEMADSALPPPIDQLVTVPHVESGQNEYLKSIITAFKDKTVHPIEKPLHKSEASMTMTQSSFSFDDKADPPVKPVKEASVSTVTPVKPVKEVSTNQGEIKMINTQEAAAALGVSPLTIRSRLAQLIHKKELSKSDIKQVGRFKTFPFDMLKKLTLTETDKRSNKFYSMFTNLNAAARGIEVPMSEIRSYITTGMVKTPENLHKILSKLGEWDNDPMIVNFEEVTVGDRFRFLTPNFTGLTVNSRVVLPNGKERQIRENLRLIYIDGGTAVMDSEILEQFLCTDFKVLDMDKMIVKVEYDIPGLLMISKRQGELKFNIDVLPIYPVKVRKLV